MAQCFNKYLSLFYSLILFVQLWKGNYLYDLKSAATENNKGELKETHKYNSVDQRSALRLDSKRGTSLLASFLPSLIITGVGTYLTLSCGIYASALEKNRQLTKKLSISIEKKKHGINIEWNNVISLKNYAERLNSSLDVLEKQMDQLYTLEEDAIVLLDPKIYDQIDGELKNIEANIKRSNETVIDLSKVYTAVTSKYQIYLYSSIYGAGAAAGLLMLKLYVSLQIPRMTTRQVKVWVRRNPKLLHDKNLKLRGINLKIDPSVKYLVRADKEKPVFERKGRFQKNHAQAKKLIRNAKIRASMVTSALTIVIQLVNVAKHVIKCKLRSEYVKEMVEKLEGIDQNLAFIEKNITNIEATLKDTYNDMAKRLQEDSFTAFVNNAYQIAKKSSEISKKMMTSKRNIEYFKIQIRVADFSTDFVDYDKVEEAIHKLAKGVKLVNEFIYCNTAELKIILTSITLCKNGKKKSVVTSIFVKQFEKFKKMCDFYDYNELPEHRLNKILSKAVGKANQSDECIRNNIILQEIVCNNVQKGFSDSKNAKVTGLDFQDIVYMKNRCVTKNTNINFKYMVCRDKSLGKSLKEILNTFKAYDQRIIESTYLSCNLTTFQKKVICSFKNEGKNSNAIKEELKNYDPRKIENVFNNCANLLNGHQRAFICTVKEIRNINDPYHQVFKKLTEKFGYKAVENVLKQSCRN